MARLPEIKRPVITLPARVKPFEGGGGFPLQRERVEDFVWGKNVFSPEEADAVIALGKACRVEKGMTGAGNNDEIRNSLVSFMYPNAATNWVFDRLATVINEVNNGYFNFDLSAMEQGLQFTQYIAPGQHYEWHIDRGMNVGIRKLSVTVQLSDPNDYEGGELELKFGKDPVVFERERGMACIFPSYVLHRVKPVTKGERFSLVAWVSGPPFK